MTSDFLKDLVKHRELVGQHLQFGANELFHRAIGHDRSKFSNEEYGPYEDAFPGLQKYAYGTDEFKAELKKIKPAIAHHYQFNDHHPEHFTNGINDMDLFQIYEMACDWLAASSRSQTPIMDGLQINKERFGISDQLFNVIVKTMKRLAPGRFLVTDPNTLYPNVLLSGPKEQQNQ